VVIGKVVNALGKTWHPEHFVCCTCSQPFPGGKFVEHEVPSFLSMNCPFTSHHITPHPQRACVRA
jgi:hypothetical protein